MRSEISKKTWFFVILSGVIFSIFLSIGTVYLMESTGYQFCRNKWAIRFCSEFQLFDYFWLSSVYFTLFDVVIYYALLKKISEKYLHYLFISVFLCFYVLSFLSFTIFNQSISVFESISVMFAGAYFYPLLLYVNNDFPIIISRK